MKLFGYTLALCLSFNLVAADQLTVYKVTLSGTSGTINGKVVGVGDYLIFVDDDQPTKSFFIPRGEIRSANSSNGAIVLEMASRYGPLWNKIKPGATSGRPGVRNGI